MRSATLVEVADPHSAMACDPRARCLHLFQIEVIAQPPREAQRVCAQNTAPAQRLTQIQPARFHQLTCQIGRSVQQSTLGCRGTEEEPSRQARQPGKIQTSEFQKSAAAKKKAKSEGQKEKESVRKVRSKRRGRQNACGCQHSNNQGWKFHARRESRTRAS